MHNALVQCTMPLLRRFNKYSLTEALAGYRALSYQSNRTSARQLAPALGCRRLGEGGWPSAAIEHGAMSQLFWQQQQQHRGWWQT